MQLKDLITKPVHECTEEELAERLNALKKLRLTSERTSGSRKANRDKRIENLLSQLSPEELKKLSKLLEEG